MQAALAAKKLPVDAGDTKDGGVIPVREEPREEDGTTRSGILAWRSPCTEEPGRLQSVEAQSQTRLKRLSTAQRSTGWGKTGCSGLSLSPKAKTPPCLARHEGCRMEGWHRRKLRSIWARNPGAENRGARATDMRRWLLSRGISRVALNR